MFLQNRFRDLQSFFHTPSSLPLSLLHLSFTVPPSLSSLFELLPFNIVLFPLSLLKLTQHWNPTPLCICCCTTGSPCGKVLPSPLPPAHLIHTHTWCTVHTQILLFFKGKRHYILCKRHKCFTEEDASRLPPTTSTLVMLKSTEAQTRQPAVYLLRSRLYLCRFKEAKS